jgi:hypothetical protein
VCLALREEYRLRMFENRVLRTAVPMGKEPTRQLRQLYSKKLLHLCFSPNVIAGTENEAGTKNDKFIKHFHTVVFGSRYCTVL